jgi:hypothetical protein
VAPAETADAAGGGLPVTTSVRDGSTRAGRDEAADLADGVVGVEGGARERMLGLFATKRAPMVSAGARERRTGDGHSPGVMAR